MKFLKNRTTTIAILIASFFILSCSSENKESKSLKELEAYVNELDNEANENWEELENRYQEKKAAAENDVEEFSEKQKAKFNELQMKFEDKKMQFAEITEEKAEEAAQQAAINKMYLTVQSPNRDLKLEAVTANNLKNTYSRFVAYVKSNQGAMSIETWKEVELIWDALNERQNIVESNLSSSDIKEIAKLKGEYSMLKTTNSPGAKLQEKAGTEEKQEMNS